MQFQRFILGVMLVLAACTLTPVAPSATPVPATTNSLPPTATSLPPTLTPIPPTPEPPTATATPQVSGRRRPLKPLLWNGPRKQWKRGAIKIWPNWRR